MEGSMKIQIMWDLLHTLKQLRQHERWTRPQIEAYQADALRRLRAYAYAHSPFYQRLHQGLTDRPLNELPVITKAMMMEHFDEFVTDPAIHLADVRQYAEKKEGAPYLGRYWVTATSGSSGHPGFFLFNEPEWLTIMASFARGQEWSGAKVSLWRRRRMATVASIDPWHMSSHVARMANSWWAPSLRLAASDPLDRIVQRLNDWRPDVLIAYASMARILAEEQIAGRLDIAPEVVFTSSEVLSDETRQRVKLAWGDEPFNQYGATETAEIAAECREGRQMHLFEDLVMVEVVDEEYQPVAPGAYGAKLLVTTLFSRTQPLIRYELSDSVRLTADACTCGTPASCTCQVSTCIQVQSCPCGRPFVVLESVQGRVEDTLLLPAVTQGRVAIRPLVFNRIMDILPVSGWQIIQEPDESLTVLLSGVRGELTTKLVVDKLNQSLTAQGASVPKIEVQTVATIPKAASGKAPLIKAFRPS